MKSYSLKKVIGFTVIIFFAFFFAVQACFAAFCIKCGTENPDDANFCHACGKNIHEKSGATVSSTIGVPFSREKPFLQVTCVNNVSDFSSVEVDCSLDGKSLFKQSLNLNEQQDVFSGYIETGEHTITASFSALERHTEYSTDYIEMRNVKKGTYNNLKFNVVPGDRGTIKILLGDETTSWTGTGYYRVWFSTDGFSLPETSLAVKTFNDLAYSQGPINILVRRFGKETMLYNSKLLLDNEKLHITFKDVKNAFSIERKNIVDIKTPGAGLLGLAVARVILIKMSTGESYELRSWPAKTAEQLANILREHQNK